MSNDREDSKLTHLWSGRTGRRETDRPEVNPLATETAKGMPLFGRDDSRVYAAFTVQNNATRLHIVCAAEPSRFPNYNYLLDIIYDNTFACAFTLIYSFMKVEVTGHNLDDVVHAIASSKCERIRQFHKSLYDPPAKGQPFIDSITITVPKRMRASSNESQEEETS